MHTNTCIHTSNTLKFQDVQATDSKRLFMINKPAAQVPQTSRATMHNLGPCLLKSNSQGPETSVHSQTKNQEPDKKETRNHTPSFKDAPNALSLTVDSYLCNGVEGSARKRFLEGIDDYRGKPDSLCQVIRQFVDSMAQYLKQEHSEDMIKHLKHFPECEIEKTLDYAVEDSLQRTVVNPLYNTVVRVLSDQTKENDQKYHFNARKLALGTQSDFGIRADHILSTGWSVPVTKLSMLERYGSPIKQLQVLVSTAHSIFECFNKKEKAKAQSKNIDPKYLSADDFFPIFLFVMVNSTLKHPHLNKSLMWGLCSRAELQGEGGYYLTVYEAAVTYITEAKPEIEACSPDAKDSSSQIYSPKSRDSKSDDPWRESQIQSRKSSRMSAISSQNVSTFPGESRNNPDQVKEGIQEVKRGNPQDKSGNPQVKSGNPQVKMDKVDGDSEGEENKGKGRLDTGLKMTIQSSFGYECE
ncbi:hypothetical protein AAMO2058_001509300 [Amorphochlora amoebiformis]